MVIQHRALEAREIDHERLWLSLALAGAALVVWWQMMGVGELPRLICPFRHITGIPCVGCGGTRALLALAHGHAGAALVWNPLVTLSAFAGLAWLAYSAIVLVARAPRLRITLDAADRRVARATAWTVLLANWIFLIAAGR
jgi:hypothetical protein